MQTSTLLLEWKCCPMSANGDYGVTEFNDFVFLTQEIFYFPSGNFYFGRTRTDLAFSFSTFILMSIFKEFKWNRTLTVMNCCALLRRYSIFDVAIWFFFFFFRNFLFLSACSVSYFNIRFVFVCFCLFLFL